MMRAEDLEYVHLLKRIHAAFGARPGRRLRLAEIVRLSGADEVTCARALRDLRASGLLTHYGGLYERIDQDAVEPCPA